MKQKTIDFETGEIIGVNDAHERHLRIVGLRNAAEQTFLTLGEELYWFEEQKQYKELGHPTFNSYLADPDVDIERSAAFRLKQVYAKFILDLKVAPVRLLPAGYSKLNSVASHVNESNVEEWVNKAAALSRSDLKREIAEAFPPPPSPPLPDGKYNIIYADPPWKYADKLIEGYGAADHHYPQMTIEELCQLPVQDLAGDNAVLFIWVTSPLLEDVFEIIKAWGFQFKTSFVWDKVKHNFGHYNSVRHELLLICTRGSYTPQVPELFDSVQSIERSNRHSQKPQEFRTIIDTLYPSGKRIELFARDIASGWEVWGNELESN